MAAILSHCLRPSPLRVHSGPGDESVECFDHLGKVPMALDPPEPLLRLHECGRAPALSHRPPSPSLHSPRQAPESSIEVLDWVRRAERLQQPATHTKVDHSHGLLEPLTERRFSPRSTRSRSRLRQTSSLSVEPSTRPSTCLCPSVSIPRATISTCSAKQTPSSMITGRSSSLRERDRKAVTCSFVLATKRRETLERLTPIDSCSSSSGSRLLAYPRVLTPTSICSTARSLRGSSSLNVFQVGSSTSRPLMLRTRGLVRRIFRPPKTRGPSVVPCRKAWRSAWDWGLGPHSIAWSSSRRARKISSPEWLTRSRSDLPTFTSTSGRVSFLVEADLPRGNSVFGEGCFVRFFFMTVGPPWLPTTP